jgi:hypothetical protein
MGRGGGSGTSTTGFTSTVAVLHGGGRSRRISSGLARLRGDPLRLGVHSGDCGGSWGVVGVVGVDAVLP